MKELTSQSVVEPLLHEVSRTAAHLIDSGTNPHLAVVLVGEHPDSLRYIEIKDKQGKRHGVTVSVYHLESDASDQQITEVLDYLSHDTEVHGIIVQLPLPGSRSADEVKGILSHIDPRKDVDGLLGAWQQQTYQGTTQEAIDAAGLYALPPMVAAVCLLMHAYQLPLEGQKIVVVGKGQLVGQPLQAFFEKLGYPVQTVDEETDHILDITRTADVLIAGTGSKDLVTFQWIQEGAVVLDCAQDVHRDSVDQVASAVSPAKGGLGPITVAWLLHNTVMAAKQAAKEAA